MAETCPLCRQRRGKRACPAKGAAICAHCCGAKRRVEIDCPSDCVYLGGHATAWEGRETERRRDTLRLAPHMQALSEAQAQLLLLALVGLNGIRVERRGLDDRLLGQAVAALRRTAETRAKGLVYDHAPEDARAQGLVLDLRGLFEAKDAEGRATSPVDRDLLAVWRALDDAVSATLEEAAGPVVFLDTAARLAGRFGAPAARATAGPLIVTP